MGSVIIRSAVSPDIEHIGRIDPGVTTDKASRALIEYAINQRECLAAFDNGAMLGYGVMNYGFFNRGFVSLIYVSAVQRRQRVGTRLFDEFERDCRSARIFTSANLSNLPMQGFLTSRGYVLSGMVQYLDEGDPEVFYSKKLTTKS